MIWAEWRRRRGWLVTLMREELDTVSCKVYSIGPRGGQLATVLALTQLSAICIIQIPCDHMNTRQSVKVCQGFLGFASGEMQGIRPVSTQETPAPCLRLHLARAAECWRGFWDP